MSNQLGRGPDGAFEWQRTAATLARRSLLPLLAAFILTAVPPRATATSGEGGPPPSRYQPPSHLSRWREDGGGRR